MLQSDFGRFITEILPAIPKPQEVPVPPKKDEKPPKSEKK